jgi:hydrogenase maturation protease
MSATPADATILVLGLGNRLLGDDAAGPLVVDRMGCGDPPADASVRWCDGGTMGLALLPEIEGASALIAVDAARFGALPGTVRVFEGAAMDVQLGGRRRSAHEVALGDLLAAAVLSGALPERRALVAVEPECTSLALEPSASVADALPRLCHEVQSLIARWRPGPGRAARDAREIDA